MNICKPINEIIYDAESFINHDNAMVSHVLDYFNNTPAEDVLYYPVILDLCDKHKNEMYCYKCLIDHDASHKCFIYDRLFIKLFRNINIATIFHTDYNENTEINKRYKFIINDFDYMFDSEVSGIIINNNHFDYCRNCEYVECTILSLARIFTGRL